MIQAILAAAAVSAAPAPASTGGLVAPCIWEKLPAHKAQVLAAPDFPTFDKLRRGYPQEALQAAFAACVPEEGDGDKAAEIAFTYYEVSLWAQRRLAGKWPQAKLAVIDNIADEDLRYFWLQPDPVTIDDGYRERRTQAWARVYGPFGRSGPAATRDDLDAWVFGRVGWRLGEMDYRQKLTKRPAPKP